MTWDRKQREEISQWEGIVCSLAILVILIVTWGVL